MAGPWEKYSGSGPSITDLVTGGGKPWEKYGSSQGDAAKWGMTNEAADMMTMGLQPKINAGLGSLIDAGVNLVQGKDAEVGANYDRRLAEQRGDQAAYEEQNPVAARAGQAAGVGAGLLMAPGVKLAQGAGMIPRTINAMATGGTYGAIGGAAQDADSLGQRAEQTAKGAGFGTAFGTAAVPVAKLFGKIGSLFSNKTNIEAPTVEQLRAVKNQLYDAAEGGIGKLRMTRDHFTKLTRSMNDVGAENNMGGVLSELTGDLYKRSGLALKDVNRVAQSINKGEVPPPTFGELEKMRQTFREMANASVQADGKMSPDGRMAEQFIGKVDDLIDSTPFKEARSAHRTLRKAEVIEDAFYRAENAAGANYTQSGLENALRQQFKAIANGKNFERQFDTPEQEAILKVVRGEPMQNVARRFGALAPKGAVSNMFNIALTATNPYIGIPVGIATTAARMGATAKTSQNAKIADMLIRNGGKLPSGAQGEPKLEAIVRLLLSQAGGRAGASLSGQ